MIHPCTELRFVNPEIGCGVFATARIPRGTLVYVRDMMEIVLAPKHPLLRSKLYRPTIDKFSYTDNHGNRVLSWDLAKYVNHSCSPNTLSTGYDFEIAIRNIEANEQITDEYGLFNLDEEMLCRCGAPNCRGILRPRPTAELQNTWDNQIMIALRDTAKVDQPLFEYMDSATRARLKRYLKTGKEYLSVTALRTHKPRRLRKRITSDIAELVVSDVDISFEAR